MSLQSITFLMFGGMLLFLASGVPMVFALGGLAAIFGYFFWGPSAIHVIIANCSQLMRENLLVAVPLFVFMAYMLQHSGVAEELFSTAYKWLGSLKGGLAAACVVCSTIIAAMSGISTAGVMLMGIIALPAMLKRGYSKELAMGTIMAGGALGPLIPPSLVLIIYSLLSGESIGKLFLGAVLPGLTLSSLFIAYILIRCYLNPTMGPALEQDELINFKEKLISLKGVILPVLLVLSVLGSIFFGLATPTEAASVGAFGSLLIASIRGNLNKKIIMDTSIGTLKTVGSVMWVIFGAGCFANIYQGIGASQFIQSLVKSFDVHPWVILIMIQIVWIILGSLMDAISILMVTSPIFIPLARYLGFDLLWFGILFAVNTEMGYLTPPFGVNLVVMKGIVQNKYSMAQIYGSVWPFVTLQFIGLLILLIFPILATWLPNLAF
jgi:tripartite ATP-independent transporter DctM subunit